MNLSTFLAYKTAIKSPGGKSMPAVKVAVAAVALSVAVMICSVAVVEGFKKEITLRVSGFNSHITIYNETSDDGLIYLSPSLENVLRTEPHLTDYDLEISVPAIAKTSSDFKGVYLRGFDGEYQYNFIGRFMDRGSMPAFSAGGADSLVVISAKMARELQLSPGETLPFYFIDSELKVKPLRIAGIYNTHFDFYDDLFVFASPAVLRHVAHVPEGKGTAIRAMISTDNIAEVSHHAMHLQQRLMAGSASGELASLYTVDDITRQSANYFSWLSLIDTNVVVIITLMSVVAAITLIASLLILVIDKIRLIGILRALGASGRLIRHTFIFLALRIALWGMIWGNLVAIALLLAQKRWRFIHLDAESYYMDYVPVEINPYPILLLNVAVVIMVVLLLLVPSRAASKVEPVKAMLYNE